MSGSSGAAEGGASGAFEGSQRVHARRPPARAGGWGPSLYHKALNYMNDCSIWSQGVRSARDLREGGQADQKVEQARDAAGKIVENFAEGRFLQPFSPAVVAQYEPKRNWEWDTAHAVDKLYSINYKYGAPEDATSMRLVRNLFGMVCKDTIKSLQVEDTPRAAMERMLLLATQERDAVEQKLLDCLPPHDVVQGLLDALGGHIDGMDETPKSNKSRPWPVLQSGKDSLAAKASRMFEDLTKMECKPHLETLTLQLVRLLVVILSAIWDPNAEFDLGGGCGTTSVRMKAHEVIAEYAADIWAVMDMVFGEDAYNTEVTFNPERYALCQTKPDRGTEDGKPVHSKQEAYFMRSFEWDRDNRPDHIKTGLPWDLFRHMLLRLMKTTMTTSPTSRRIWKSGLQRYVELNPECEEGPYETYKAVVLRMLEKYPLQAPPAAAAGGGGPPPGDGGGAPPPGDGGGAVSSSKRRKGESGKDPYIID